MLRCPKISLLDACLFSVGIIANCYTVWYIYVELQATHFNLFCSMFHSIAAVTLMWFFFRKIVLCNELRIGPVCLIIMFHLIYLAGSSYVYFGQHFVMDLYQLSDSRRFMGSLIAIFVVAVMIAMYSYLPSKKIRWIWNREKLSCITNVLILLDLILKWYLFKLGIGSTYSGSGQLSISNASSSELMIIIIEQWLTLFVILLLTIHAFGYKKIKDIIKFCAFIGLHFVWQVFLIGGRSALLNAIIMIGVGLSWTNAIRITKIYFVSLGTFFILLAPISVFSMSALMNMLDRPTEGGIQFGIDEASYRTSLTDYAMSISGGDLSEKFSILKDSIIGNAPRILFPEKSDEKSGMDTLHLRSNLPPEVDYPDTLFSLGATYFGVLGMLIVPVLYLWFVNKIENLFRIKGSNSEYYKYIFFVFVILGMNIEIGAIEIGTIVRNLFLFSVIISIIFVFSTVWIYLRNNFLTKVFYENRS